MSSNAFINVSQDNTNLEDVYDFDNGYVQDMMEYPHLSCIIAYAYHVTNTAFQIYLNLFSIIKELLVLVFS